MNRYPLWKNLIIVGVIIAGFLLALPNLFGDDPALHITREDGSVIAGLRMSEDTFSFRLMDADENLQLPNGLRMY